MKTIVGVSTSASGGEVLIGHRSRRKRTRGTIKEGREFQGVRTPRYQICHRLGFIAEEPHIDLGEVETAWEV